MTRSKTALRIYVIVIFICATLGVAGQQDTTAILDAVVKLETALVEKNKSQLESLLHKDVAFGHSNGWVQSKKDVLKDMESGFLAYERIDRQWVRIEAKKKKAIVKERFAVKGKRDNREFDLSLFAMQVWIKSKKGWQLFARQTTKL